MSETFPTAPAPIVTRLNPGDVPAEVVDRLRTGAIVAPADVAVLDLTGPGAVASFQGLLTSDIEQSPAPERSRRFRVCSRATSNNPVTAPSRTGHCSRPRA